MRFRGRSIRRKIVALLLVPLVSLSAIWAFSAVLTWHEVQRMLDTKRVMDNVGYTVEDTVQVIQQERRQALVHLADPRRANAAAELNQREQATDRTLKKLRANALESGTRESMSTGTREWVDAALQRLDDLESLRRRVNEATVTRNDAYDAYNAIVDPLYSFLSTLNPLNDVEMAQEAHALTEISRGREAVSREDALLSAAFTAGRFGEADLRSFTDAVAERRLLYRLNLPMLPSGERDIYENYWQGATGSGLRAAEDAVIWEGTSGGAPRGVDPEDWQATAGTSLKDLDKLGVAAVARYDDRVRPKTVGVLVKAGAQGGLGLIAVFVSIFVSVRISRGLIRDLSGLRREALEASGTRLPRVMRRLAAGEQVDVETEVPRLEYTDDEVGQVGKALNSLQRAAVEAAVRQADMRRGVSDVFVNLARRSQVLLHRQLTLLDAMERRTDGGEELADLFRLDHMTTRMRRHAEGLVILSGASPSRQWRKPVQLMDVARAAVAEVEDYERVEVRRMPRLAVSGTAVADVTHLIAELIENATVFSPPHTAVQVHGEAVPNGFVLEIDDRGLGLTPDALLEANLRLAETPEFELSDTDRLGLFVVSRLAQRQGVRVSLRPSPFGGTTAVVLVPSQLLTDGSEDGQNTRGGVVESAAEAVLDKVPGVETTFRKWGLTAGPAEAPAQHQQARDPGNGEPDQLPRRRRSPVLVSDRGRSVPGTPAPRPAPDPQPAAAAERATGSRAGGGDNLLPRRVRQASLAPQLRSERVEEPSVATAVPETDDARERSAAEVRSRMASMQRGWQRGRANSDNSTAQGTTPEGNGR